MLWTNCMPWSFLAVREAQFCFGNLQMQRWRFSCQPRPTIFFFPGILRKNDVHLHCASSLAFGLEKKSQSALTIYDKDKSYSCWLGGWNLSKSMQRRTPFNIVLIYILLCNFKKYHHVKSKLICWLSATLTVYNRLMISIGIINSGLDIGTFIC